MAYGSQLAGLFTGNPVQKVSATGQPLIGGSESANLLARSLGGLVGKDMRTPVEVERDQKAMLNRELAKIDPSDPQKMAKMYGLLAQYGEAEQKILAMGKMQEFAQNQQNLQRVQRYRDSLIANANQVGLAELAPQIVNADETQLKELAKTIGERQLKLVARGDDDRATELLAQTAGIGPTELKATYGDDLPQFEEMEKILARGDKGSIKPYIGDDGKARMYSVLGTKVLINGKWQEATSAGLAPAPQQLQTLQLDGIYGKMPDSMKDLVNDTVTNTIKLGQEASDTLAENTRAQQLLDDGIFTGLGADALVEISRVGSLFGIDTPTLENTQAFALERYAKVAEIIKDYGSGTGLSNADREFALAQAGVPTYEKATLERMLRIERHIAEFQLNRSRQMVDEAVKEGLLTPAAARILDLGRGSIPQPTTELSESALRYVVTPSE